MFEREIDGIRDTEASLNASLGIHTLMPPFTHSINTLATTPVDADPAHYSQANSDQGPLRFPRATTKDEDSPPPLIEARRLRRSPTPHPRSPRGASPAASSSPEVLLCCSQEHGINTLATLPPEPSLLPLDPADFFDTHWAPSHL